MINAMNVINFRSPALPARPGETHFPRCRRTVGDTCQMSPAGAQKLQ